MIKEYLLQFKEKDELDSPLCDLFFQMGYIIDNRLESGNRQYGVDIRVHNENEILIANWKKAERKCLSWGFIRSQK